MMRKTGNKPLSKSIVVIADGDTEKWYLDKLKEVEKHRLPRLNIKPDLPKKKSLKALLEMVKAYAMDKNQVVWIVDLDTILKESKLDTFLKQKENLEKNNVVVIINHPCFEPKIVIRKRISNGGH